MAAGTGHFAAGQHGARRGFAWKGRGPGPFPAKTVRSAAGTHLRAPLAGPFHRKPHQDPPRTPGHAHGNGTPEPQAGPPPTPEWGDARQVAVEETSSPSAVDVDWSRSTSPRCGAPQLRAAGRKIVGGLGASPRAAARAVGEGAFDISLTSYAGRRDRNARARGPGAGQRPGSGRASLEFWCPQQPGNGARCPTEVERRAFAAPPPPPRRTRGRPPRQL